MIPEFKPWPKIHRWSREWIITEKIDGTNAAVIVPEDSAAPLFAQSRNRIITPESDHYDFAKWVRFNSEELRKLGPGTHFGEWWGMSIARRYNLLSERRFSLFNVSKWSDDTVRPKCCHVVPELAKVSPFENVSITIQATLDYLKTNGSVASPGFTDPEGIVIFHVPSQAMFKKLLKNDELHKGER